MAEFSTCTARSCKTVTPGIVDKCPVCGNRVVTSRRIRVLGWLSIACGVILVGLMGYITVALSPTLTHAGVDMGEMGRWNGTAEQARMVLILFYLVIGFGVLAMLAGAWMVATGRRHIAITIVTLAAAGILLVHVWRTTEALKEAEKASEARRIVQPPAPIAPVNLEAPAPDKPSP